MARSTLGNWLGRSFVLFACAWIMSGCTPPVPVGNDNGTGNSNTNDNVVDNDNGTGQEVPTELVVPITGEGEVEQESLGEGLFRLTGVPADGWRFDRWSGSVDSFDNPLTVQATMDTQIGATFVLDTTADADADGVADGVDLCPETPAGATVNEDGCAPSEVDTDGDEVTDDLDDCPNTPAGTTVDATGCPIAPADEDGDGVPDTDDDCPETPAGAAVDEHGCAASEVDSDNDGVADVDDECPNTPANSVVDAAGCVVDIDAVCGGATGSCLGARTAPGCEDTDCCTAVCTQDSFCCTDEWDTECVSAAVLLCDDGGGPPIGGGGPVCGNGTVEAGEDCDPADGTLCGANCRFICGNGVVQGTEQCEPPNTATCDGQCRTIVNEPVSPQGDWLSSQFILNGAAGVLAFESPESYRLNASGGLVQAFVTPNVDVLEFEIGGDLTVLNTVISPGVPTDVFRMVFGVNGSFIFRAQIDQFSVTIAADDTVTWNYDYTTTLVITDPFLPEDLIIATQITGVQHGTVGGDPSQIIWTDVTASAAYCDESYTCDLCVADEGTCDAKGCCVFPLDPTFLSIGTWTRSGG